MSELFQELGRLTAEFQRLLWPALMVFLRVGTAVSLLPGLAEGFLPLRIKLAAAVVFTLLLLPALTLPEPAILADWRGPGSPAVSDLLAEVICGAILGLSLRMFLLAVQTAGSIIGQSLSLAQMFNGIGAEPQPAIASLMVISALAVFAANAGLARAVVFLLASYESLPPGAWPVPGTLAKWLTQQGAQCLDLAFRLAAPFLLVGLLYNLALGAINRAMPMLMVMLITAPLLSLIGFILLIWCLALGLMLWRDQIFFLLDHGL